MYVKSIYVHNRDSRTDNKCENIDLDIFEMYVSIISCKVRRQ